jgi:two-component system chemotaxis response regulator CheY
MHQTVIIADDAQFMRVMLRDILETSGFQVVAEAADGRQAIDVYGEYRPDLALLDITMPGIDGIAACREIVQQDPEAKVVVISALGQRDAVLAAIRAGAADFVVKPFEADRVVETLLKLQSQAVPAG